MAGSARFKANIYLRWVCVAMIVIVVLAVLWALYLKHQYNGFRAYEEHADQVQSEKWCVESTFFPLQYCRIMESAAGQEVHRSDENLRIQQEMADWNFGALILSLVGLAVSVLSLAFLIWSLGQTQEAINDNKKIGRSQVAAYLSIERGKFTFTNQSLNGWITVKNYGQSPAQRPSVRFRVGFEPVWFGGNFLGTAAVLGEPPEAVAKRRWLQAGAEGRFFFNWTYGELGEEVIRHLNSEGQTLTLHCHLEWRDVFDDRGWIDASVSAQEGYIRPSDKTLIRAGQLHLRNG